MRVTPHEIHVRDTEWVDTLYQGGHAKRDKYPPVALLAGTPLGGLEELNWLEVV